jgi:hypothetical protein
MNLVTPADSASAGMASVLLPAASARMRMIRPMRTIFVNPRLIGFSKIFKEHVYES